jgi:formylglycine-generating enzyme required for sulfatase activity
VGEKKPDAFGLYDMSGNVLEWVEDCWHNNYKRAPTDGSAWLAKGRGNCNWRVRRGGSWNYSPRNVRSSNRFWFFADYRFDALGFRLA